MGVLISLFAVIILGCIVFVGVNVAQLTLLFGVIIPYIAISIFVLGVIYRVIQWARSPVPFRITTTCGQQKSLPWIKANNLESPHNIFGVIGRMALEVLCFRSLFRNTKAELQEGPRLAYAEEKWLWLGAIVFHWTLLVILLRHNRFFTDPLPYFVSALQSLDGLFQIGVPVLYLSDLAIMAALLYLLARRLINPQIRYLSLPADYFALFLILGIVFTGVGMRHLFKVDIAGVKQLAVGLISLNPVVPQGIGVAFYIHLFLVCALLVYFPFSKLMHVAGVFLSPTRNLANNNRMRRHVNPWNPEVKVHTYEEWEDDFRDKIKACGLPLERES